MIQDMMRAKSPLRCRIANALSRNTRGLFAQADRIERDGLIYEARHIRDYAGFICAWVRFVGRLNPNHSYPIFKYNLNPEDDF